jgi:hypothetical protein
LQEKEFDMWYNSQNHLRPALLAAVLAVVALAVVIWLATPGQTTLAGDPLSNSSIEARAPAVVHSSDTVTYPMAQIWSPSRDAIITQKGTLTISGYAWEDGAVPPFIVDDPVLSVQRASERSYYVAWTEVVSADNYILHEAQSPDFGVYSSTVVPASTLNKLFDKGTDEDGTYYYRVQASYFGLGPSRWSNVESVVIPWSLASGNASTSAPSSALAPNDTLTVEVRIDSEPWQLVSATPTDWGGWQWSYLWSPLPEEADTQHVIQARATDVTGTVSLVDSITVTLDNKTYLVYFPFLFRRWPPVPYAPTLNAIDNADKDDNYTVSWSYDAGSPPIPADSFTLQEATDANFTSPTNYPNTTGTSIAISDKSPGTYYYRVRGNNSYGFGEWSNVVSTQVAGGFFDDFSSTSSGWAQGTYNRGTSPDGPAMKVEYVDGTYRMKILLDTVGLNNKRMGVISSPYVNTYSDYDVEVDHYFARASDQLVEPTWGKSGLIFGANSTFSTIYVIEWHFPSGSDPAQCAVYKYNQVTYPISIVWLAGGVPMWGWAPCTGLKRGYNETNHIRVEVRGTRATIYINSSKLGTFTDSGIGSNHRVGLMVGSWERTPVEARFDNFRVTRK